MQLVDRIEKRRFVGREFLLWLWFESELFEATLNTDKHGSFGLWLERRLVLSEGKESTRVTAPMPGAGREAKEALLKGQLPENAGVRIAWNGDETSFQLKADQLSVSGLKLQTVLGKDEDAPSLSLEEIRQAPKAKKQSKSADPDDEVVEAFYERMRMTEEFEALLATLYRDFLSLRLTATWSELVEPALRRWARDEAQDADAYAQARNAALKASRRRPAAAQATAAAPALN